MSQLLDRLRVGLVDAQKRQAEALKQFQAVQAEYQAVTAEVTGYQKVLEIEARLEEQNARAATTATDDPPQASEKQPDQEINKTQLVKDTLAAHPGMTPSGLWKALRGQIGHRNYVYSVLKRLKDKKQIIERRGKYYVQASATTQEEDKGKEGQALVQ